MREKTNFFIFYFHKFDRDNRARAGMIKAAKKCFTKNIMPFLNIVMIVCNKEDQNWPCFSKTKLISKQTLFTKTKLILRTDTNLGKLA